MRPRIFKIDPYHIDLEAMRIAAEAINNRGLVAFPTETVYGLGANALDPKAVAGIFEAKKRPLDDPLIVHIVSEKQLFELVEDIRPEVERLVEKFWPGPLTLVLPKKAVVPDIVTTGLDTVAVRMPSHPVARKLIEVAGVPLAAPSANLFGRPSPTSAKHVVEDLDGLIDIVLDAGDTEIGVESTVIEVDGDRVIVLRPGGTPVEDLLELVGEVEIRGEEYTLARSPGRYPRHYSPRAKVSVVDESPSQIEEVRALAEKAVAEGKTVGIMARQENESAYRPLKVKVLGPADDLKTCASRLFGVLREFDAENADLIIAEGVKEKGLGLAIMNRLRKASGPAV